MKLGDIVVPDMHNNVPEAVLLAHDEVLCPLSCRGLESAEEVFCNRLTVEIEFS